MSCAFSDTSYGSDWMDKRLDNLKKLNFFISLNGYRSAKVDNNGHQFYHCTPTFALRL